MNESEETFELIEKNVSLHALLRRGAFSVTAIIMKIVTRS